jgi:FkbM family methyltransferase
MMMKRLRKVLILPVLFLLAASATIYLQPRARWRAEVLIAKVSRDLPDVNWEDVAVATMPRRTAFQLPFSALDVEVEKQAEGSCSVLWRSRFGFFWGSLDDRDPLRIALKYRVLDEVYLRGPAAIRPGDIVIDGGSHLGTFSRFALDRGARLVVAIEPDSTCADCLRKTFREEISQGRVIVIQEALWDKPGKITFHQGGSSVDGSVMDKNLAASRASRIVDIDATTVDEIANRLKLERVDYVKLHVEGSEKQALAGARQTLIRFKPRIIVQLDHRPGDPQAIPKLVREIVPAYQVRMRGQEQAYFF